MKAKREIISIVLLVAVLAIGGTYALWSGSLTVNNELKTADYNTIIEEKFVSPSNWLPGTSVDKESKVANKGTVPVFTKVSVLQQWTKTDADGKEKALPMTMKVLDGEEYVAQINWSESVVALRSDSRIEDKLNIPVINKISDANGKWLLSDITNTQDGKIIIDFYYMGVVEAKASTPLLTKSVKLNDNVQQEVISKKTTYNKEKKVWETVETKNPANVYEAAKYDMILNGNTVQATNDLATTHYGENEITKYLNSLITKSSNVEPTIKTLAIKGTPEGGMIWNNPEQSEANKFMVFNNIIPGGSYDDIALIKNETNKKMNIYMKVKNIQQEEQLQQLLKSLKMSVKVGDKQIYSGTAMGDKYNDVELTNAILLGTIPANGELKTNVNLLADLGIDNSFKNKLTKVDWEFYGEQLEDPYYPPVNPDDPDDEGKPDGGEDKPDKPDKPDNPDDEGGADGDTSKPDKPNKNPVDKIETPQTGDETPIGLYAGLMAIALAMLGIGFLKKKKSK
ncbi:MAG: BsaA family SipW-dependent biofilm matrix protein [Anaerovoracaceae bacterium]